MTVAIKSYDLAKIKKSNLREEALKDEIRVLARLDHPNLLRLYAVLENDPGKVHIVTDYV